MSFFRATLQLLPCLMLLSCGLIDREEEPKRAAKAPPPPAPAQTAENAGQQSVLVTDSNGKTIYFFDADKPNKSSCVGDCAVFWPPVRPDAAFAQSSGFGVITRADGTQQVTFQGRPLYTYKRDEKPGDTKGDGQRGTWHALRY